MLVGSVTLGVAVEAANTVGPSCEEKFPDDYGAIFVDVVVYIFCSMSCKLIGRRVISFAAVFRDVTQRSLERNLSVSLNTLESVSTSAVTFLAH